MVLGIVQDVSESNDPKKYARLSAGTLGVALWEWGQATGRLDFIRTADSSVSAEPLIGLWQPVPLLPIQEGDITLTLHHSDRHNA